MLSCKVFTPPSTHGWICSSKISIKSLDLPSPRPTPALTACLVRTLINFAVDIMCLRGGYDGRCVCMQEFTPLSVIGEGHFGKVLLVRWKNGDRKSKSKSTASTASLPTASGSIKTRAVTRVAEGDESSEGAGDGGSGDGDVVVHRGSPKGSSKGFDEDEDCFLAVKEVALHKNTSVPGVLNERQILGLLTEHPFVVTLQCAWRRGNFLYYGLDFLPGADLFELFRRQYMKMDMASARVYGGQVALALEHLHAHGICYRDLKVCEYCITMTSRRFEARLRLTRDSLVYLMRQLASTLEYLSCSV